MDSAEMLKKNDIRPSVIRVMIYDYINSHRTHPTVDEVYQNLHSSVPTLSKTSVYNTVKLFAEKNLLKVLPIDGMQIRYDADTAFHGHFLCKSCMKVYDFTIDTDSESGLDGFEIKEKEIFYSGYCRECLKNNKKKGR